MSDKPSVKEALKGAGLDQLPTDKFSVMPYIKGVSFFGSCVFVGLTLGWLFFQYLEFLGSLPNPFKVIFG